MNRRALRSWQFTLVLCALSPFLAFGQQAAPVRAVVITSHPASLQQAMSVFEQRYGTGRLQLVTATENLDCAAFSGAGAVFVEGGFFSEQMLACGDAIRAIAARGAAISGTMASLVTANWRVPASPKLAEASNYLHGGGMENLVGFLVLLHNAAGGQPPIQKPALEERAAVGIYHPDAPGPFPSLAEYENWLAGRSVARAPRVGILFFKGLLDHQETAPVDALIRALERRSLAPVAVFGWPLNKAESLFTRDGKAAVDLMLLLDAVMPSAENGQFLEDYGLHAMNLLSTTATEAEWRRSESGLPPGRLPIQVGNPERYGVSEPIVIAAAAPNEEGGKPAPIRSQIELAAARAARWITLRTKPNWEKRLALIYYNNPPGKASLGASYLDLIPSLRNVVARLRAEGYLTGDRLPDAERLKKLLLLSGRNVGEYAPGELEALLSEGHAALLPVARYEQWFAELPRELQERVIRAWGPPRNSKLMTVHLDGKAYFVMAGLRMGNLWLAPQPLRGEIAQADAKTHDRNTPPPHSYIAAYLWIRKQIQADAIVHFGRHGTLEWLPGKDVAQAESDPGSALVGDLPHVYYYLVDGGGEFLQAKRRSNAVIVSHLTPALAAAGVPSDFVELKSLLQNYDSTREGSPLVAEEHAQAAWTLAKSRKLDEQLKLSESDPLALRMERLSEYVHDLEEQAIPIGLHRIGEMPSESALLDAVTAYLNNSATPQTKAEISANAPAWAEALVKGGTAPISASDDFQPVLKEAEQWLANLRSSPSAELDNLITVLNGRHISSGVSGDPLRAGAALPTGRNLHDQDPRGFPSKAAWAAGQRLATELIRSYQQKHGTPPKRVSFVLWYGESGRTQGLQEAQALALLGVRPVWNGRGQVADVELIPAKELGRPRVDVVLTMSGLYRDGMPEKLALLDKAVRLVREAAEDNAIQAQTLEVENELIAAGVDPELARKAARARIFGPQPGVFGVGMAGMMEFSRDAGDTSAAANLYLRNMNYAYGAGLQGVAVSDALKRQLKRNEVVVHGRSSNLYGLVDNDETYQFAGGLNAATREASGRAPEFLIANARKAGAERYDEAAHFLKRELTTRLWNEKWIEGMKGAGYAGAQQIAKEIEHLYGFRSTAPEQVDATVWQETLDTYIKDKRNLGLDRWFRQANPHARQMVAARLIEIDRQGVYRFSSEDRRALVAAYVQSVKESGVSCYANACANRNLIRYVAAAARDLQAVPPVDLQAYEAAFRKAAQTSLKPATQPRAAGRPTKPKTYQLADFFKGMRVFEVPLSSLRFRAPETATGWVVLLLPMPIGLLIGLLRRRFWTLTSPIDLRISDLSSEQNVSIRK
ncbi:MAG: cobaltochelatase subunit CobN [Bryobacteraceae bacterium]